MTSSQPDVSLIVPCYNQARFLQGLFDSVQKCTNLWVEIVVIDDGSPNDDAINFLGQIGITTPSVSLVLRRTLNCGLSAARNVGLQLARGRYIKFLDADDLLLPGTLETQVAELDSEGTADFHLIGYCTGIDDLSSFSVLEPSTLPSQPLTPSYVASAWETELSIPIHTALFRASSLTGLAFNEEFEAKEDWVFWHSVAQRGMKFILNPELGVVYRTHPTSMTRNRSRMARFWLKAIKSIIHSGTHLNLDEEAILIQHFNSFYSRHLNHGLFESAPEGFMDSIKVHLPLTFEDQR
jgi:glycosyltransferase involved in cell wall biosynthesis